MPINNYYLGIIGAIVSALFMASQRITTRRAMVGEKALSQYFGVMVTLMISVIYLGTVIICLGKVDELFQLNQKTILSLGAAGIIHFVIGRTLSYSAFKYIGINYATPYLASNSFYGILFGVFFLGERPTIFSALSALLLLSGVLIISIYKPISSDKRIERQNARKGILCALGGGLAFGSSPPLIRLGLLSSGSAITGSFVSYLCALIVYLPLMILTKKQFNLKELKTKNAKFFILSGVLVTTANWSRYFAFCAAPLWLVMPIAATTGMFSLILTSFTMRKYEVFNPIVIIGIFMSIIGVFLLAFTSLS